MAWGEDVEMASRGQGWGAEGSAQGQEEGHAPQGTMGWASMCPQGKCRWR